MRTAELFSQAARETVARWCRPCFGTGRLSRGWPRTTEVECPSCLGTGIKRRDYSGARG